jgi:hypothetical protein
MMAKVRDAIRRAAPQPVLGEVVVTLVITEDEEIGRRITTFEWMPTVNKLPVGEHKLYVAPQTTEHPAIPPHE